MMRPTPAQRRIGLDALREASDDRPSNPRHQTNPIGDVIACRMGRRDLMKGLLATTVLTAAASLPRAARAQTDGSAFAFQGISHGVDQTHHVAPGHTADVLLRWGDPIFADAPAFDPNAQSAEAQARQFGYNNDFIGLIPVIQGETTADRALLVVNHEYTNEELMFPDLLGPDGETDLDRMTAEMVAIEQAAHGGSIVEIERRDGRWTVKPDSPLNRRITAATPMALSGPAAGHPRLQTAADPTGRRVLGTMNNCAGGVTPWGTWLMAEENFHGYFSGELTDDHPEFRNFDRYGVPGNWNAWGRFDTRFDISREPNEANRFGWVVEVDPRDPTSIPVKRTALGRTKHEGAEVVVNGDGRIVLFMGDDQRFDYVYRFVSTAAYDPADPVAARDLLDDGVLSVARYDEDGMVHWLPLIHGQGPLTAGNGFDSQADVLIETRRAADLLGATPMDRPEDVEPDTRTGRIYVMLTNNSRREPGQENAANPRADNRFGHIIEMMAPDGDFTADQMAWDMLVQCGDPAVADVGAVWNAATGDSQWFGSPDNCALDAQGRLWIATDQGSAWPSTGTADGLYSLDVDGEARGLARMFFRVPVGAELCGPRFTDDGRALFLAVQHPASDGVEDYPGFERVSTFSDPATRWPDFQDGMPPRPSVLVVTKDDGGLVGG